MKNIDMRVPTDEDLGASRFVRLLLNQRQQTMGRRAADDFECTRVAQLSKCSEQIAFPFINEEPAALRKQFEVELAQFGQLRLVAISFSLTRREIDEKVKMPDVALAQKIVLQHRAQRRRERHRELERHV